MHCHQNRFKLCIGNPLQFHSKRMSLIVAYHLLIVMATIHSAFNLYLYESQYVEHPLMFCYFISLSLCFGRTLMALWLFHSWIQFNFGTVHSQKTLKMMFRIVRSTVLLMAMVIIILHIVQHINSVSPSNAETTFGALSMVPAVTLSVWSLITLIRLEIKNEIRLSPKLEGDLERNGCWTPNGLLTRFLWIVVIVSALWIFQCALALNGRLWNDAIIDGEGDEHDVSRIVIFFGADLSSMILLLILYYMLLAE